MLWKGRLSFTGPGGGLGSGMGVWLKVYCTGAERSVCVCGRGLLWSLLRVCSLESQLFGSCYTLATLGCALGNAATAFTWTHKLSVDEDCDPSLVLLNSSSATQADRFHTLCMSTFAIRVKPQASSTRVEIYDYLTWWSSTFEIQCIRYPVAHPLWVFG